MTDKEWRELVDALYMDAYDNRPYFPCLCYRMNMCELCVYNPFNGGFGACNCIIGYHTVY